MGCYCMGCYCMGCYSIDIYNWNDYGCVIGVFPLRCNWSVIDMYNENVFLVFVN